MRLAGFQPLSLIDYPATVASVIFTQGCMFRCPYCHNPELIPLQSDTEIEPSVVLEYLTDKKKMLQGVCITGGEPTMHHDLPEFIGQIRDLGLTVKLDTNGTNPAMVEKLINQHLVDYVAMDLKHRWAAYDDVVRSGNKAALDNCQKTFSLLQSSGVEHEFRTTISPGQHQEADFFEMAGYLKPGERYYLQNTQFTKNLEPGLPRTIGFDLDHLVQALQTAFPQLEIAQR